MKISHTEQWICKHAIGHQRGFGSGCSVLLQEDLYISCFVCRYFTLVAATVMLTVGLSAKPDTNIGSWARKEAAKELKEEGKL